MTKPSLSTSNARDARCGSSLYLDESAIIPSNITAVRQSPHSPEPQKAISALPS